MVVNKNERGTASSTLWATPSAYEKQNDGEPGQTAGQISHHYEGMPCREAGAGRKNTSNVPDCNVEHWNYVRQVCRSSGNIA